MNSLKIRVDTKKPIVFLLALLLFSYVFLRTIIPYQLADVCLTAVLFFLLTKAKYNEKNLKLAFILILFFISLTVSALFNFNNIEILDYFRIANYVILMLIMVGISDFILRNYSDFLFLLKVFSLLTAIYSLVVVLAVVLFYIGVNTIDLNDLLYIRSGRARGQGLFDNPNYYSFSIFLASILSIYIVQAGVISKIVPFVIILGGLASFSRGYILGLIIFIFTYQTFKLLNSSSHSYRVKSKKIRLIFSIFVVFLLLVWAYFTFDFVVSESFSDIMNSRVNDGGGGASARFESIINWYNFGAADFRSIFVGNGGKFYQFYSTTGHEAHNTYFRILGENGLVSFFLFMMVIFLFTQQDFFIKRKFSIFNLSWLLSLIFILFTNDYHILRDFWLSLFFLYIVSQKNIAK